MIKGQPKLYVIAGPNGSGKTTFVYKFLPGYVQCANFVNADLISSGLSPFSPESVALRSGKLMLEQIRLLSERRMDFGFETTLAGKTYVSLLKKLKGNGRRLYNLFHVYRDLLDTWTFFDNSTELPRMVAYESHGELTIADQHLYDTVMRSVRAHGKA